MDMCKVSVNQLLLVPPTDRREGASAAPAAPRWLDLAD